MGTGGSGMGRRERESTEREMGIGEHFGVKVET